MATAPSPNDLTRQQLDELDALLQRMLTLPITAVDPPPPAATSGPPTTANWRADPPAPAPVPAPHLAPVELPRPPARVPKVTVTAVPAAELAAAPQPYVPELAPPPEPAIPVLPAAPPVAAARVPVAELPPAPVAFAPEPMAAETDDEAPIITRPARTPGANASRSGANAPRSGVDPARPTPTPAAQVVVVPPPPVAGPSLLDRPLVAFDRVVCALLGLCGPPGWLLRSGFGKNLLGLAGIGLLVYTAAHVAAGRGLIALPFPLPWPK